jgi:dephospho-CoA kinase
MCYIAFIAMNGKSLRRPMNKIFFVIGASGSGKTTVINALDKAGLSEFKTVYFDSIGVPTLEEMIAKYNGPEEWQRIKTAEWVKTIKETLISDTHVILDGQTRPIFIEEACIENEIIAYEAILFDCSDEERTKRLAARGHAVELLRGLYKSTGNIKEQKYWETILEDIKETGSHLPEIVLKQAMLKHSLIIWY